MSLSPWCVITTVLKSARSREGACTVRLIADDGVKRFKSHPPRGYRSCSLPVFGAYRFTSPQSRCMRLRSQLSNFCRIIRQSIHLLRLQTQARRRRHAAVPSMTINIASLPLAYTKISVSSAHISCPSFSTPPLASSKSLPKA